MLSICPCLVLVLAITGTLLAGETLEIRAVEPNSFSLHRTGDGTPLMVVNARPRQRLLEHPSEHVRAWAIQFLCEDTNEPAAALERFEDLAANDPASIVRLYLASALQRMPAASRRPRIACRNSSLSGKSLMVSR